MPSLSEEAREWHQAEWSCCSWACLGEFLNYLHLEQYYNPFLRCLLCPFWLVVRFVNCFVYSRYAKQYEEEEQRELEREERQKEDRLSGRGRKK